MSIKTIVQGVMDRYVAIETKNAIGSGIILMTSFVLTCFHCLKVDSSISVNGKEAEIVDIDPINDLTLLAIQTEEFEQIPMGEASLGEPVFSIGNPMGLDGALLFGRVVFRTDKRVIHDMHGQPGISGSGLFNFEGELIGINSSVIGQKHIGSWLTIATPSENMGKILSNIFLSNIFQVIQPTLEEIEKYGGAE